MISFACWKEQIPDSGEDAKPLLLTDEQTVFLGVWDGLGGAGSRKLYWNHQQVSEARIAAEIARTYFAQQLPSQTIQIPSFVLAKELQVVLRQVPTDTSGIRSKLLRRMPTTFAGLWLSKQISDWQEARICWAGDSRIYSLHPRFGLRQLTKDDVSPEQDAFAQLQFDGLITNCLSADQPFCLHETLLYHPLPCLWIAATDGAFHYLPSPASFEEILLETILSADSSDWASSFLQERLDKIAGDDVSLIACGFGFQDWSDLQQHYFPRYEQLLSEMKCKDYPEHWETYKLEYEKLIG
ncbi:MAG: hypothetical protein NZ108_00480 [Bacteroidia bacterium]|nr:hypothetical protein [Bacteroidia bacterium]